MENQLILAIETATSACSVALETDDKIICRYEEGSNIHSQRLLEMIDDVFRETGTQTDRLSMIAVGQGPGSFTGLRIGIGVAQGIAFAVDCPIVGVSSLQALALRAADAVLTKREVDEVFVILAGIDARMGEVYWAEFVADRGLVRLKDQIIVSPPELITTDAEAPILVGNAWSEYEDSLAALLIERGHRLDSIQLPRAKEILLLAKQKFNVEGGVSAAKFEADYVRNNVAKKSSKQ